MLAERAQLEAYLRTAGTVSGGAALPSELLDLLLASASSRLVELAPERTLDPLPAAATDPPVELVFPIDGPRRVFQVPDLREVAYVRVDGVELATSAYTLRRRPAELCALWLKLRTPAIGDELAIGGYWGPAGARVGDDELAVSAAIRDAVLVWAARAFHNRAARYADTAQAPDGGVASYFRNLPPDVKLVVDGLRVPGV